MFICFYFNGVALTLFLLTPRIFITLQKVELT